MEMSRSWSDMTHVCLVNIFGRLELEDRWRGVAHVCKSWREASMDPSLWPALDVDHRFQSASPAGDIAFWWSPEFERRIDAMLRSATLFSDGQLTLIRLRHCSDHSLAFAVERCPRLEVLSIKSCPNVTDLSMVKVASCSLLKELDISYCYEISYKSLELIGRGCPNLKILKRNLMNWLDPSQHSGIVPSEYLNACPQDGDREASKIAAFMRNLEHLELRFSKMTGNGLESISKACGNLEYLDLFGCANLTSRAMDHASVKLKNLKTFVRPNFYIPRSLFHTERYGHWRLYDDRFQTGAFFQI